MRFLLDPNILSEPCRQFPNANLLAKLQTHHNESVMAATTWHELKYGCDRLPLSKRQRQLASYIESLKATMQILPYDKEAATWHAQERSRLSQLGLMPPFADGQIAAISVTRGLILVTNNIRDFQYFDGLEIENWFESS